MAIPVFESDPHAINRGANAQAEKVKRAAAGDDSGLLQKVLLGISKSKACLLNPARKSRYDQVLRAKLAHAGRKKKKKKHAGTQPIPKIPDPAGELAAVKTWTIGRSPNCDLVVADAGVSRHHCRLIQGERGVFLEDLRSGNGTYLNGRRITATIAVCSADRIRLGPRAAMPWPDEIAASELRLVRIGRAADNDVVLDYPTVSAHHAVLRVEPGRIVLEDLGSRNGTALGSPGRTIRMTRLSLDDVLYFGACRATVEELLSSLHRPASR